MVQVWMTKVNLQESPCGSRFMKLGIKYLRLWATLLAPQFGSSSQFLPHHKKPEFRREKKKKQFGGYLVGPAWHYVGMLFREDSQNSDSVKSTI